jgi:muramidase (phage lysozyme)
VAQGLSSLDTGLGQFLEGRQKKLDDGEKIRAEALFNQNNAMGWAEAVKQGKVPANASPVFMRSYKEAQGNLAGIQLREKFNGAYLNWDGKNSNDSNAFQGFLSDFIKNNVQTDDPDVLKTLNEHVKAMWSDGYSHFAEESAKSVYNGSLNTRAAISSRSIDAANDEGLGTGKGTNYDELWNQLMAQRDEALHTGTRHEDYDKELVKTISAKAMEHGDPALLDLLDKVLPGDTVKMSDLPDFRDMKADTIAKLTAANRQRMVDEDTARKKADTERERTIQAAVSRALATDPNHEIPEDVMQEWERYDGLARKKLAEMRKTLADAGTIEERDRVNSLLLDIRDGAGSDRILKAVQDSVITNPSTLKDLLDRADKYAKARKEGSGILTGQTAKRYLGVIRDRTNPKDGGGSVLQQLLGDGVGGLTNEGLEATQDFENMLMEWDDKNPSASLIEREKAINEIGGIITSRIDIGKDASSPDRYRSNTQIERDEGTAILHPDGEPTPIPADLKAPTKTTDAETYFGGDQPPLIDRLPDEVQRQLEANTPEGVSPEEFNADVWKEVRELLKQQSGNGEAPAEGPKVPLAVDPTKTDSITFDQDAAKQTSDAIGQMIDNVVANGGYSTDMADSAVAPILKLIGYTEGTAERRGYNETLGYGAYTGGDKELTKMTLGQIKKLQAQMLAHPDNKWNSSALGQYQIVGKTLRKLQQEMGLSDDTLFDEKTQDAMALQLLKGRGFDDWMAGKISDAAFMNNLSKEWASLPTTSGKGYYSGQNARVKPASVLSAFAAMRGPKG